MLHGARVLVVDDEQSMRELLELLLRRQSCTVDLATCARSADAFIQANEYDVVLTDLRMPDSSGLEVLAAVKARHPKTQVLILTAFATTETAVEAMKQGAYDYLIKPFKVDELLVTLERALEKRELIENNELLRQELSQSFQLDQLLGRSRPMQQIFSLVRKIAATKTSVLISGESGTGKELVARAIHALSDRPDAPFVPVNCGAIPDSLMESELFGHARGAFTGAHTDKAGLFRSANGGTIFLDEIGELGAPMQVKLLRALQEHRIKPVGVDTEVPLDLRVLAATNRELGDEVAAGRFRSDLYYRLNVIPLRVPPLRERRDDIPLMAEHFLRRFGAQQGRSVRLTPEALALLARYHFPGNVRELENLIERAVTLASGREIDASSLPELSQRPEEKGPDSLPATGLDLDAHMAQIERKMLLLALERTSGNRTEAARLLGMTLRSIRYRLAKYGIDPDHDAL